MLSVEVNRILDIRCKKDGKKKASARANLGEPREVDGQQAGGGFLAVMRRENNSPVLLKGKRGLALVHHLQLRANGIEHDLQAKD